MKKVRKYWWFCLYLRPHVAKYDANQNHKCFSIDMNNNNDNYKNKNKNKHKNKKQKQKQNKQTNKKT